MIGSLQMKFHRMRGGSSPVVRLRDDERGAIQIGSWIGLIGVTLCLLGGAVAGKPLDTWAEVLLAYVDVPSIFITIGGTIFTFILAFTPPDYRGFFAYLKFVFNKSPLPDPEAFIPTIVSLAEKARREGLLSLEDNIEELDDDFLKRALQLVIDGTDPELVKAVMNIRVGKMQDRHNGNIGLYNFIEVRAPAFGLIGTILGLVQLLRNLSDPSALGPSLAVALITTFYGVILANAFAGPFQNKLANLNDSETLLRNLMIEGVLAIQSGDNPRIVEEKLLAFLSVSSVKQYQASRSEQ